MQTSLYPHQSHTDTNKARTMNSRSTPLIVGSRRRTRRVAALWSLSVFVVVVVVISPAESLSAATATRNHNRVFQSQTVTDELIARTTTSIQHVSYWEDNEDYEEDDNERWEEENEMEAVVSSFQRLQRSTGSEILQAELQQQIDQGPRTFLDQHGSSELEKVAMSSITEQLPQAAVQALLQQQQQPQRQRTSNSGDMRFSRTPRVSVEQELQLARVIQTGVSLHSVQEELEEKLGRPISRLEWAEAVSLSTKELRQTVSAYRKAKHDLVTANMGLVHAVVNQQCSAARAVGISKEELVQEGSLGLLRAAELFDPARGLRFSTYAVVWIKGVLSNSHLPELVRVPAREKTKWNKIVKAQKDLRAMSGSETASLEELASVTGLTVHEVIETQRRMSQAQNVLSLDLERKMQSRSGTESGSLESTLTSDKNFSDEADLAGRTQLQADVIAALARNLDAREARLLRLRYGLSDGLSRSLQECADAMGLSYSRVHQLSKRCLKKLREAAEAESLEEYLMTIA